MLEYNVKATGVEELERLTKAVGGLEGVLSSAKGSGKSLEEVRKIILGLKGQAGVFEELAKSIRSVDPAVDRLQNSFRGMGSEIAQTIRSELQKTRGVLQTEIRTLAVGLGSPLEKQIAAEVAGAVEDGTRAGVARAKSVAAKARAQMTAAYETLVGGDGFKQLSVDDLGEVKLMKEAGATISKYHAQMLANYENHLRSVRRVDAQFQSALDQSAARARQTFANFDKAMGLDKSHIVKSAKDSASVFQEAFAQEATRGRQTFANFNAMLGISNSEVAKSAKESAAVYNAAFAAEARAAQRSAMPVAGLSRLDASDATYAAAMRQMKEYYQQLDPATVATKGLQAGTAKLNGGLKQLTVSGNDAHSMARGLASGFNLLWLTWGNLAPLFAGAAISNGFMQTAKAGMEIAHTLEIIQRLGENTADEIVNLTDQMIYLGYNGPRGPKEIAEAFKVLSLAGLKANEVLAVTQTVLDFSTAGTTDLETAADVLVSVTTAFGTGAAGFERSADIIARAAADSKASVESFGEAMKTASVVGEQYGATQEDVALQIQYLAQLGIQGTAAGTAIRNMYADITGRSGQVTKILKQLELDFKDVHGNVVPLTEQMRMLSEVLSQYDAKSQGNILQAIFGERGAKSAIASMQAYQASAKDSSKYTNKLEEDLARVSASAGEAAINAAYLGQTTKKAFEAAGATFQTTMYTAFQEMEPQLYLMANAFREAFASPEAREGLSALVSTVATLGVAVAENLEPLTKLALAWGAYRLVVSAATGITTLAGNALTSYTNKKIASVAATQAAAAAETALAAAATASGAATALSAANTARSLSGLLKWLPIVGNVVAIGSGLWMIYETMMNRAGTAAEDFAGAKSKNILEALRKENEHIEAVNAARLEGIGLAEAEARVKSANQKADVTTAGLKEDKERLDTIAEMRKQLEGATGGKAGDTVFAKELTDAIAKESKELEGVRRQRAEMLSAIAREEERRRKNAADSALIGSAEAVKAQQEANNALTAGTKSWNLADFQGGGRGMRGPSEAQKYFDEQFEAFKKLTEAEKGIVATLYEQGKVSATDYYDWIQFKAQQTYEAERVALQARIEALAGDPKSQKAFKEAQVNLDTLDMRRTAEILKMEQERNKAISERLTPMQRIVAAGEESLQKAKQPTTDILGIQRGGDFAAIEAERVRIQNSYADQRLEIEKRFIADAVRLDKASLDTRKAERDLELQAVQSYADKEFAIILDLETRKRNERANAFNGVQRAIDNYVTASTDAASLMESVTTSAFNNFEDSIVSAMTTGKLSVKDFVVSALTDLARLYTKQALGGLIGMFGGAAINFLGGGWSSAGVQASGAVTSPVYTPSATPTATFAKGGAFQGSPSLSAYSNQVHSTPKLFAFAKGGVFGEAGPEAIMPLTRGPDGNLGVRNFGAGGQSVTLHIETTVNVTSDGTTTQSTQTGATNNAAMDSMAKELNVMIEQVIVKSTMPGGVLWSRMNKYA